MRDLQVRLKQITSLGWVCPKQLASVRSKILAMGLAFGPVARLMTRSLHALLNTRSAWCNILIITPEVTKELRFWGQELESFNGQDIWHSPSAVRVVYTDASNIGYGGYTVEHGCHIAHGLWTPIERLYVRGNSCSIFLSRAVRRVFSSAFSATC